MNNVSKKSARWIWVIVGLQIGFLLTWAGYHEWLHQTAPTVRLKTLPVDPRDILRGDYMVLNYDISLADGSANRRGLTDGDVYVLLKPVGGHYVIDEVVELAPAAGEQRLWVHANARESAGVLRLEYGIEQFFVPEGQGTPEFKTLDVEASISGDHRLYIKRLWLDGKRFH